MASENEVLLKTLLSGPQGVKLLGSLDKLSGFVSSQSGREALELLSKGGGDALKSAAAAAIEGDKDAAARLMSTLTSTPDGAKLLQSIIAAVTGGK